MSLIDNWIARFRRSTAPKARERVLVFDRYEEMSATQALRYKDLQAAMAELGEKPASQLPDQPWYSLKDAAERLGMTKPELLRAAADEKLLCFVYSRDADGYWDAAASTPVPASVPDLLAVPVKKCQEVLRFGSANLKILEYHHSGKHVLRYRLRKAAWIDSDMLYFQHPLPVAENIAS